jgi:hypothetical protein
MNEVIDLIEHKKRNWRLARQAAKAAGLSRMDVYQARLISELPGDLFKMLLESDAPSVNALVQVAKALKKDNPLAYDVECCQHCGGPLRRRLHVRGKARDVLAAWLEQKSH